MAPTREGGSKSLATLVAPMIVATDPVVTQSSDWTVTLAMQVDTRVHLTATVNKPLQVGSGYVLEIHDLGAPSDRSEMVRCYYSGTTCSITTTPEFTDSRYIAIVTMDNSTQAMPGVVLAVSGGQTPPPWTIGITPTVTTTISITATTNYALDAPARYLSIYDNATGSAAASNSNWCSTGTTCVRDGFAPKKANSSYTASVATYPFMGAPTCCVLATSSSFTPPPWTVSLTGSGSSLTATGNYAIDATNNYFEIFDLDLSYKSRDYLGWCSSGISCTLTTPSPGHRFVATVGTISNKFPPNPMLAVSNQVGLQGPTAPYETSGGSNPAEMNDCFSCVGDPVNTLTGEFFENDTDITVPSRGPVLEAARTYSSQRAAFDGTFGFGWSSPFSLALSLQPDGSVQIRQENGSQVVFTPTGTGAYAAPSRVLATLAANGDGTWTYTRRSKTVFTFTQAGKLTTQADLNGNFIALAYNEQGKLSTATDGSGRTITFTYGSNGRIATATDPANRSAHYGYDAAGRLQSVTLPGNRTTNYTYDAANLLTSVTDPRGSTTVNAYDLGQRVVKQTTAAGDLILAYGSTSTEAQTTITSPGGGVTRESYRAGQMISRSEGLGTPQQGTWTYAYDPATLARTSVTDPLNRTSRAAYDQHGNKLSATDAGGGQASASYDAAGNMLTSTDAAGTTTTFTYDSSGNRLTSSRPLAGTSQSAVVASTYGDSAHPDVVTAVVDPNGNSSTFGYDTYGNRTTVTDALGRTTTTAFDILGRKTSLTSPSGTTTSHAYDAAGFLATITDPLGKISAFTYDAAGNKTTATDRQGRVTSYAYDALGRHTTTTTPDGAVSASGYDGAGNLISQTDQSENVTAYAYDSRNRLTSSTDGLNRTTTYGYDAASQLTSKTDPSGRKTTLSYNAAGDKTVTSYSDGVTPKETFTYTALHRPATITDGTGTTTMSYDSLGRLTSRTDGSGKTVGYSYDLAGNITGQTYPNGQSVARTYDAANNLTSLTDWLNNTTTFTTTADGRPASTIYPNSVTAATTYDAAGLATAIEASTATSTLATFSYTRNDNGYLASAQTAGTGQGVESYGYTDRDQLATINASTYSYDPAGNPTALAAGATLTYDAANQPTQFTRGGTTTPITHDSQGNRLTGPAPTTGTSTYTWNQANRLTTANGTTFIYDANGLRTSKTPASGPAHSYTWDTNRTAPLMLSDGAVHYIYDAAGNPLEHIDATGNAYYYQHDQYGSTRLLTDGAGAVAATYTFDPHGNVAQKTGTADTTLRWNGQAQDFETGLYYLRARYYDPTTVQFLGVDPLASMTRAIYTYADNNPLNKSDPLGLYASPLDGLDGGGSASVDCAEATVQPSKATGSDWCSAYGVCEEHVGNNCFSFNNCGQSHGPNTAQQCAGRAMLSSLGITTGSAAGQAWYTKNPKWEAQVRGGLIFGAVSGLARSLVECVPWGQ
ncbi:MAG TPA: RHS repeat-associated core domain-containing protein [Arthrobacter sp.]